jgi:hypothetical protein
MVDRPGFFDMSDRLRELSAKGDDLERIAALVDFAQFCPVLDRAVPRPDGSKGGRPAFDRVLMFKVLLLQAMHGLSDEGCEYLIKDRLSFMRFLGPGLADPVPDANTIWTFREALKRAGRWTRGLRASTPRCGPAAIWRWAGRSSMRRSWPRRSSAAPGPGARRTRPERSPGAGGISLPSCARRIAMRAGR